MKPKSDSECMGGNDWAQRLEALKQAAEVTSDKARLEVEFCLWRGKINMEVIGFERCGYQSGDHFLFGEVEHLIGKHLLPLPYSWISNRSDKLSKPQSLQQTTGKKEGSKVA